MVRVTRVLGTGLAGAMAAGMLMVGGALPAHADLVISTESLDPAAFGDPSVTGPCFRDQPFMSVVCPPQLKPADRAKPLDPKTPAAFELIAFSDPSNFDMGARYVLWDLTAVWYYAYSFGGSGESCNVTPPDAVLRSGRGQVGETTVVSLVATQNRIGTVERGSGQAVAVPARRTVAISLAGKEGKQLCVTEGIYLVADGPTGQRTVYNLLRSRAAVLQIGQLPQATAVPEKPSITALDGDAKFSPGYRYSVYATVAGELGDAVVWGRWVTVGIVSSPNVPCSSSPTGSAIRYNVASSGVNPRVISMSIPRTASAGSWVCTRQELQLTNDTGRILTSATAYRQILPAPTADAQPSATVTLSQAIAAVAAAQSTLGALLTAPTRDDAALRAALLAAQNAQADLQGAVGNANAGDAGQAVPVAPAQVAQAQQQLEQISQQIADAGAQVSESAPQPTGPNADGAAAAGGAGDSGVAAGRAASAAAASGVNLANAPIVGDDGRGTGSSAALTLRLAASPKVNRGRFITMRAAITPASGAGRVRISLVRFNAKGKPISSKAIYAPVRAGVATKRWRIPTSYTPSDFTLVVSYEPKRRGAPGVTGTVPVQIG